MEEDSDKPQASGRTPVVWGEKNPNTAGSSAKRGAQGPATTGEQEWTTQLKASAS